MARLLCINAKTWKPEINNIGDVVGEFPDSHQFSDNEKLLFDIIDIPDIKVGEIRKILKNESKELILNERKFPKYLRSVINLTSEDLSLLKTSDKNIKINILKKLKNNINIELSKE